MRNIHAKRRAGATSRLPQLLLSVLEPPCVILYDNFAAIALRGLYTRLESDIGSRLKSCL